jgi:hypothetical protein
MVLLAHQAFKAQNNLPTAHPSPEAYTPEQILPPVSQVEETRSPHEAERFITVATALGDVTVRQMAPVTIGVGSSHTPASALEQKARLN